MAAQDMGENPEGEFQAAIYRALLAVAAPLGARVYDDLPQADDGAPLGDLPCFEIGDFDFLDWSDSLNEGFDVGFRVYCHVAPGSDFDLRAWQARARAALHYRPEALTLPAGHVVQIHREQSQKLGRGRGVCDYRALIAYPAGGA